MATGIMTADQAETLCEAVASRANILVAVARTQDRVVIIEDTREL